MGTPIDDVPVGVDNINCWGSGKPFGDIATPRILFVTFSGVELVSPPSGATPEFVNSRFALTQLSYSPTNWFWQGGLFRIWLQYSSAGSGLQFEYGRFGQYCFRDSATPCTVLFNNDQTGVNPSWGKNGIGVVDFDGF